ncbi:MAG: shikimate kinase [Acidimicrobiales bacterium]
MTHSEPSIPHTTPNVVLTGFSGTGKSTVGRFIAQRLGFGFVDTDLLIEARWGPIPAIFAEQGEATFRSLERIVAAELSLLSKLVIATGGGTLLNDRNVTTLGRSGHIVCLCASPQTILERVSRRPGTRPLLAGANPAETIACLLAERAGAYAQFDQVDTTGLSHAQVADAILSLVSDLSD